MGSKSAACMAVAGLGLSLLTLDVPAVGQEGTPLPHTPQAQTAREEPRGGMPIYKAPPRSGTKGRFGDGIRGKDEDLIMLAALAPDHTGLTVKEQPTLHFFYVSRVPSAPLEFSIIEENSIHPLVEKQLSPPRRPGVQQVRLADFGIRLRADVKYEWLVAVTLDPKQRSKAIVVGGVIERVALPAGLSEKLARTDKTRHPHLYAEAGLWYDAISVLWDLIDAHPNDPFFRKQRASLLEQIGLPKIAEQDNPLPAAM